MSTAKWLGYYGIGLMSVWVNVHSGYCPVVRISGRANFSRASVHGLLYGQVTVRSGYYLVGLLSDGVTVCRLSVHSATISEVCVLREVSWGVVSGWASFRIPYRQYNIYIYIKKRLCLRYPPTTDLQFLVIWNYNTSRNNK